MKTILMSDLKQVVRVINMMTTSPQNPYEKIDGKFVAQIGCYHLDGAYGGWELQRISSLGGGCSTPLGSGHVTKRELYTMMQAFLRGLEAQS